MGFEGWLTMLVLLAVTVAMAREYLGPDLVMFSGLTALVIGGVIEPTDALAGFANPALITIGVLFVIAGAVQETGGLVLVSRWVLGRPKTSSRAVLRLMVSTSTLSAFLNNIPIVALLIPAVADFAKRMGESPSRYLMPLSFAAMLGGTCTLIGTSSNLVVSGLLQQAGEPPFEMLELTWVGLPTAILGILYMTTIGRWLLTPRRDPVETIHEEAREYLAEVEVATDSPLIGQSVEEANLRGLPGLYLMEIRRKSGEIVKPVAPEDALEPEDHLVFIGLASTVQDLRGFPGLRPVDSQGFAEELDENLFEVVVSHRSPLVGRGVREAEFRRRFGAAIIAVHRAGERIESKIGDIVLQPGDTLMLSAAPGFAQTWRDSTHFYLVSSVPDSEPPRYQQARFSLFVVLLLVIVPTLTAVPMLVAAMGALVVLLLTGCITPRNARRSVSWSVLVLVGSAFGVSHAMETSGVADLLASVLMDATVVLGPRGLLAGVYILTVAFAFFVGNAASAALVFPVAITSAAAAGLDVRPFAVATAMAAAAAFSTPIGYAANLLVYGPGGYRYLDFTRVGLPLNVVCLTVALIVIPLVWPLVP